VLYKGASKLDALCSAAGSALVYKCPLTLQNTSQIRVYTSSTTTVLTNSILAVWCCCCVCDMAVVTSLCCRHILSACCVLHHSKQQPKVINASNFCTAVEAKRDELLGSLHTQRIFGWHHTLDPRMPSFAQWLPRWHAWTTTKEPLWRVHRELAHCTVSTHPSAAQCLSPAGAVACPSTERFPVAVHMHPLADTVRQSSLRHQGQKLPTRSRATTRSMSCRAASLCAMRTFGALATPPWTEQYKGSSR
jgi:hypothetical protein